MKNQRYAAIQWLAIAILCGAALSAVTRNDRTQPRYYQMAAINGLN